MSKSADKRLLVIGHVTGGGKSRTLIDIVKQMIDEKSSTPPGHPVKNAD